MNKTFWDQLTAEDQAALAAAGSVRAVATGAVLCGQGRSSGRVFMLRTGRVNVFRDDSTGHRTMLAWRGPGDLIGELSAIDGRPVSGTVIAAEPTTALVVAATTFVALCQVRSAITWSLLQITIERLRECDLRRGQYRADVRHRTMLALLSLAEADAEREPGARRTEQPVVLRLTQQDLANQVAASLVSVTRVLDDLRSRKALVTGRGRILVYPDRLRALQLTQIW